MHPCRCLRSQWPEHHVSVTPAAPSWTQAAKPCSHLAETSQGIVKAVAVAPQQPGWQCREMPRRLPSAFRCAHALLELFSLQVLARYAVRLEGNHGALTQAAPSLRPFSACALHGVGAQAPHRVTCVQPWHAIYSEFELQPDDNHRATGGRVPSAEAARVAFGTTVAASWQPIVALPWRCVQTYLSNRPASVSLRPLLCNAWLSTATCESHPVSAEPPCPALTGRRRCATNFAPS